MSTATYDRPLHAVPTPPEQQALFAFLLAARRRAHQALDALLALPRGAAGWVLRHLRPMLDGAGEHRLLGWASAGLRGAAALVRGIGLVPLTASLLSAPPIWRATTTLGRAAGSALASCGRGLWTRLKGLLQRSGATGDRVVRALSSAGDALTRTARTVASHPAAQPVIHAASSIAGLVRPLSHSVVAHRLLGLLVPALWVRVALELVAIPLLVAPGMPAAIRSGRRDKADETANGPAGSKPGTEQEAAPAPSENGAVPEEFPASDWEQEQMLEPLNRAERRAQQQEQARARRARARH